MSSIDNTRIRTSSPPRTFHFVKRNYIRYTGDIGYIRELGYKNEIGYITSLAPLGTTVVMWECTSVVLYPYRYSYFPYVLQNIVTKTNPLFSFFIPMELLSQLAKTKPIPIRMSLPFVLKENLARKCGNADLILPTNILIFVMSIRTSFPIQQTFFHSLSL